MEMKEPHNHCKTILKNNGFIIQNLRIMKLTTLLLIFTCMQVMATGFAQKVTLNVKNESLTSIFKKIESQTGYIFLYSDKVIKSAPKISYSAIEAPLNDVLKSTLGMAYLDYSIEGNLIIISKEEKVVVKLPNRTTSPDFGIMVTEKPVPPPIIIRGVVKDEEGKPIERASVVVKGTKTGTTTNANGEFSLDVPSQGLTLEISAVGYQKAEVRATSGAAINIVLKLQIVTGEDVVLNTGLFRKSDKSFTGATTTVTAKELAEFGNRNLITSLRNIDPAFNIIESNAFGSNPNRLPEIQVRGNSSIPNVTELQDETRIGLNTPLIIIDGFQTSLQKMYDLNENEVESITLLKDAAATAMYGSRGANGVVVITTRAPQMGKLRLSLRSDINLEAPDLKGYNLLNARDKLDLEYMAGYFNNARAETDLPLKRYYNYLLDEVNRGVETDWLALPLRNGIGQRHNIRIEGGDRQFRYSASAQYNGIEGVMKKSYRRTFNGNIALAYTYRNLRLRNNIQILQGKSSESPYGTFSDYARLNAYWAPYDSNGKVVKVLGYPGNTDHVWYSNPLPGNPLYNATLKTFDKTATTEIFNTSSIEWTIINNLILRAQLGLTKGVVQSDRFRPADHTAFANYTSDDVFRKGDYLYGIRNYMNYDGSINLQYSKVIDVKHIITAGADYNIRQNQSSNYSFLAEGFPNANFDFVSMALQYAQGGKPNGNESLTRAVGATATFNYIYDGRYFVDGSYRVDGASQFGTNKKFAPFWSVGAGWNLHSEKAIANQFKNLNRLKIRGSVGVTGSQNFDAYQALSTYQYYTGDRYFAWMGSYLMGLGNPNLKWQQQIQYNIGIDAEFFNRRLKFTGDYYTRTTDGLISSVNLPLSSGFSSYVENIGSIRNKGFELKLTGVLINSSGFTWSVTAAALQNRNKIIETSKALKDAQNSILNGTTDPGVLYIEGYSSNTIWVVPSLGIDPSTGKELYLGKDGLPTYTWKASDIVATGNRDADLFGNFSTMLRYKDFSINAAFRYTYGGQQYNQTLVNRVELTNYKYNVDQRVYYSRWKQPGDVAAFKGILVTTPTYKTSRFVQDENTLILSNVNFQYNITNKAFLSKMRMQAFNITANASEPMYLSTIRRERGTSYPFARQFSLTLNTTF